MSESVDEEAVLSALASLGKNVGGLEVGHLIADPTLLALFGGDEMRRPSIARQRLARHVRATLLDAIDDMQPLQNRATAQAMLGSEPELWGLTITQRVEQFYSTERGGLTINSFNKRRPVVLRRLAAALVAEMDGFDLQANEAEVPSYDSQTTDLLRQMVWHAQSLGFCLMGFRFLEDEVRAQFASNPEGFDHWQAKYRDPLGAPTYSLYDYLRVGEIVLSLRERPDGRLFLRRLGWNQFAFASLGRPAQDWTSALNIEFGDSLGTRIEYQQRLAADEGLLTCLDKWTDAVTNSMHTYSGDLDQFPGFEHRLTAIMSRTAELLDDLFDLVPEDFASTSDVALRTGEAIYFVQHSGIDTDKVPSRAAEYLPEEPDDGYSENLWSALTLARFLPSDDWFENDGLPLRPNRY